MKNLGIVYVILKIKIFKISSGLVPSQLYYIEKILKNKYEYSPLKTPIDINLQLAKKN